MLIPLLTLLDYQSFAHLTLTCRAIYHAVYADKSQLFRSLFQETFDTDYLADAGLLHSFNYEATYKARIRVLRRNKTAPDLDALQSISGLRSIKDMLEQNHTRNTNLVTETDIPVGLSAVGITSGVRYLSSYLRILLAPTILPKPYTLQTEALAMAHIVVYNSRRFPLFREDGSPAWPTLLAILRIIIHLVIQRPPPPVQITHRDFKEMSLDNLTLEGVISFLHWEHLGRLRAEEPAILDYNMRGGLDDIVIAPQIIHLKEKDGKLTGEGHHASRQRGPFTIEGEAEKIDYGPGFWKLRFVKTCKRSILCLFGS